MYAWSTATNRDLEEAVRDGTLPRGPLLPDKGRDRSELPAAPGSPRGRPAPRRPLPQGVLVELHGRPSARAVTPSAPWRLLQGFNEWPGNVRQLRNVVETSVLVTPGDMIDVGEPPARGRLDGRSPRTCRRRLRLRSFGDQCRLGTPTSGRRTAGIDALGLDVLVISARRRRARADPQRSTREATATASRPPRSSGSPSARSTARSSEVRRPGDRLPAR